MTAFERHDRCETCAYWERGGPQISAATRDPAMSSEKGTCQARPPETVKVVGSWCEAVWPVTHASRWCGHWEPLDDDDDGAREDIPGSNVVPLERAA